MSLHKMAGAVFTAMVVVDEDERRQIKESVLDDHCVLSLFTINDNTEPLGNHYHKRVRETFVVIAGPGGLVKTARVDKDGKICEKIVKHTVREGSIFTIKPFYAHQIYMMGGTKFLVLASNRFDPNDIFPCDLG